MTSPLLLAFFSSFSPTPPHPRPPISVDLVDEVGQVSWELQRHLEAEHSWGGPSSLTHTEVSFVKQHAACFSCLYHLPSHGDVGDGLPEVLIVFNAAVNEKGDDKEPVPFLPSYPSSSLPLPSTVSTEQL